MVPSFHPVLVHGVASYSLELLRAVPDLDVVYVPIGLGSGICGMIAAREALGLRTPIVGVVSAHAPAYALSFAAALPRASGDHADRRRHGLPHSGARSARLPVVICARMVRVTDGEVEEAMRLMFTATHNVAEGAGAAPLAAAMKDRGRARRAEGRAGAAPAVT